MKKVIVGIVLLLAFVLVFAGCKYLKYSGGGNTTPTGEVTTKVCPPEGDPNDPECAIPGLEQNVTENATEGGTQEEQTPSEAQPSTTIEGIEGDLIKLKLEATDPDGDPLTYTFTKPLNENGQWQTKDGDAGKYLITVTASDGKASVSQDVLLVIKAANKAPTIECPDEINVNEGEVVKISCNIFDVDGDDIVVDYSGWMKSDTYQTTYDDAGSHTVVVRAADKNHTSQKEIIINVKDVNRAPVIEKINDIEAMETEIITIPVVASDPDGDKIKIQFSDPFDEKGVWKTRIGDAGTYPVSVIVSDGKLTSRQDFNVVVKQINTAPVLKTIPDITVSEGDKIVLPIEATDREGDKLTISFTGFMSSSTYQTTYNDAYPDGCSSPGCNVTKVVTVTVSDGYLEASQDVSITIIDKNRPPVFIIK